MVNGESEWLFPLSIDNPTGEFSRALWPPGPQDGESHIVYVDWHAAIAACFPLSRPPGVKELLGRVKKYHEGKLDGLNRVDTMNLHNYICALEAALAEGMKS